MTDEELETVYEDSFKAAFMASPSSVTAFLAALRAVFLAGARAQREMEPTPEMLELVGTIEGWDGKIDEADDNHIEWFCAMQRVAPLVGGGGDAQAN